MNDKERNLLRQIGRTGRAMYAAFEAQVGQALPRWRILQALHDETCATQKELARHLLLDPGALTRQMKALEAEGLVVRRTDPNDNRVTAVSLTKAGAVLVESARPLRQAFSRKALQGLPADELAMTLAVLKRLEDRFLAMSER
ncbi:MAG: MarR family winged helix-turn-helix transcriptional regulator [Ignavibacteria bacterium]